MSIELDLKPASEVYQPPEPNKVVDADLNEHYAKWGYRVGYEVDADEQAVPEGGNTAVFRIPAGGLTEPVYVTKTQPNASFAIRVLSGSGKLIKTSVDQHKHPIVEEQSMNKGDRLVIKPNEAYTYINVDPESDLIIHDVAKPAFTTGDDVELAHLPSERNPDEEHGFQDNPSRYRVELPDNTVRTIMVPDEFFDLVGQALIGKTSFNGR